MKYCPNCGTGMEDSAHFCIGCGYRFPVEKKEEPAPVQSAEPVPAPAPEAPAPVQSAPGPEMPAPVYPSAPAPYYPAAPQPAPYYPGPTAPETPETSRSSLVKMLVFSIIGLSFGFFGVYLGFPGIVGIVFSFIAKKKVRAYYDAGGAMCGMSKASSALSKAGAIVSIIMTVLGFILFWFYARAICTGDFSDVFDMMTYFM